MFNGVEVECDCEEQMRLERIYRAANIPAKYFTLSFDDFFDGFENLGEVAREYVDKFEDYKYSGRGLTFTGPLGTGKTFVASLILKELVKQGRNGLFFTFGDILDFQRNRWDDASNEHYDELRNAEILVIDEIPKVVSDKQRDFFADVLENVIRFRVNATLPTILTTNISGACEKKAFPRVFSLLSSCQERHRVSGDDQRVAVVGNRNRNYVKLGERRPIV